MMNSTAFFLCILLSICVFGCSVSPDRVSGGNLAEASVPGTDPITLSWNAPTTNTDGSPLVDLAGYTIYYGRSSAHLKKLRSVPLGSEELDCREVARGKAGKKARTECTYMVRGLGNGPHSFTVRAYNRAGRESGDSNVATK